MLKLLQSLFNDQRGSRYLYRFGEAYNQWFLLIFSILVGLFLFALDNTVVADVQPVIVQYFGAVDKVAWIATAFVIPGVPFMLAVGQIFQVVNAKWCYLIGIFVFELGSALCGMAPNIYVLIAGRVLAGAGATVIYIGSLFLISVNTREQERCKNLRWRLADADRRTLV